MSQRRPGLGRPPGEAPGHRARAAAYPFAAEVSERPARFWGQDGAWLDQGAEGTCVAFASAHRIADAPRRKEGITDPWARELYLDATADRTYQQGTYANVVAEELVRRGLAARFEWATSPADLAYAVKERGSVLLGIPWYESMFDPYEGEDGKAWLRVNHNSGLAGGHEILANGLRTEDYVWRPFYRLKNSWGRSWGDGGTARIDPEDLYGLLFGEWGDAMILKEVA